MPTTLAASILLLNLASAEMPPSCGKKLDVDRQLSQKYGESELLIGTSRQNAVRFYLNSRSKTWTIVVVLPTGVACLVAAGDSMELAANWPEPLGPTQ